MNKAVFIDRDGVINDDTGHYYVYKIQDFKINVGIIEGLKILSNAGFKLIVITNQAGIAKGVYSYKEVEKVHQYLISELKREGINLTDIYYCPHHESVALCDCRKPKPGMILKAVEQYNIDPGKSFLIGDSDRDIEAGQAARLGKCYKIESNESILDICKEIAAI